MTTVPRRSRLTFYFARQLGREHQQLSQHADYGEGGRGNLMYRRKLGDNMIDFKALTSRTRCLNLRIFVNSTTKVVAACAPRLHS